MNSPLHDIHAATDAEFQAYGAVQVVSTFGEPQAEYAAIHRGVGLMDLPQRGVLQLTGRDRLDFLNRLLTNKLWDKASKSGLAGGEGAYAFLLNNKGRIVADFNVLERGDHTLLEMDGRMVDPIRQTFDKYLFAEQVKLASRAGELHELALYGPRGAEVLGQAGGGAVELRPLGSLTLTLYGVECVVWRDDVTGSPGHHLIVPGDGAAAVWAGLTTQFPSRDESALSIDAAPRRGVRPIGWAAFNAARIEAGRPLFGIDFDDSVLPAETGQLERAVSFNKGCYLGQEIVARMHARAQTPRLIVGLRVEGDYLPIAGAPISDEAGNEVGGVTSSTVSPILSKAAIALGLVKKAFTSAGSKVIIPAEGASRPATVVPLPFVSHAAASGAAAVPPPTVPTA